MKKSKQAWTNSNLKDAVVRVRIFWGDILYETRQIFGESHFRVGITKESDLVVPLGNGLQSFDIVTVNESGDVEIRFLKSMRGHWIEANATHSIASLVRAGAIQMSDAGLFEKRLEPTDQVHLNLGFVTFVIDRLTQRSRLPMDTSKNWRQSLDRWKATGLVSSLVVAALLLLPDDRQQEAPVEIVLSEHSLSRLTQAASKAAMGEIKSKDGGAAKGDEGAAPAAQAKSEPQAPSLESRLSQANLGTLFASAGATPVSGAPLTGRAESGHTESKVGSGLGIQGAQLGGGGKAEGLGRMVGKGEGGFGGTGHLGLAGNALIDGNGAGLGSGGDGGGGLDRGLIESVVKRRQDRIRLCYERELNFNPSLGGKVAVHFVIGAEGQVLTASILEDTMKSREVRQCIQDEVQSWTFPRPQGGKHVTVDYPFVFESSAKAKSS